MAGIFKEGFFTEEFPEWPGKLFSVKITEPLESCESDYHLIEVFRGEGLGICFALDGRILFSDSDEFFRHEMLAHVPAYAHESPENMLVVGGSGGVVRELLKHPCCEHIDVFELDPDISSIASKYLPWAKTALNDSRVDLTTGDASALLASKAAAYDLIVVESYGISPISADFVKLCRNALARGGVLSIQSEPFQLSRETASANRDVFSSLFVNSGCSSFPMPTAPAGILSACIGCDDHAVHYPSRRPLGYNARRYKAYSIETHKASFAVQPLFSAEMN